MFLIATGILWYLYEAKALHVDVANVITFAVN